MASADWKLLWARHVSLTYVTVSAFFRAKGDATDDAVQASLAALNENQREIGGAVGGETGAAVTALLLEHISIAVDILVAIVQKEGANRALAAWDTNGQEISKALAQVARQTKVRELSDANVVWRTAVQPHLVHTTRYVVAYAQDRYEDAILNYNMALNQAVGVIGGAFVTLFPAQGRSTVRAMMDARLHCAGEDT